MTNNVAFAFRGYRMRLWLTVVFVVAVVVVGIFPSSTHWLVGVGAAPVLVVEGMQAFPAMSERKAAPAAWRDACEAWFVLTGGVLVAVAMASLVIRGFIGYPNG